MSVTDQLRLEYNPDREEWRLMRGRETFYDEDRFMRVWTSPEDARMWAELNLNEIPLWPKGAPNKRER